MVLLSYSSQYSKGCGRVAYCSENCQLLDWMLHALKCGKADKVKKVKKTKEKTKEKDKTNEKAKEKPKQKTKEKSKKVTVEGEGEDME